MLCLMVYLPCSREIKGGALFVSRGLYCMYGFASTMNKPRDTSKSPPLTFCMKGPREVMIPLFRSEFRDLHVPAIFSCF